MIKNKYNSSIYILYVEDEELIRNSVYTTLKNFFKCTAVKNGLEALELFESSPNTYNLIVTDINMPYLDGLSMSKKIREINKSIPIIITTAYNEQSFLFEAIEIGISQYVVKPLDIIKLIETINKTIEPLILEQKNKKKEKEYQKILLEQAKYSAIGELTAGITHEINTPLTYMKSSFELIEMDIEEVENLEIKESIQSDLKTIKDGFQRIENIISSMKEIVGSNDTNMNYGNVYSTLVVALSMAYNKSKHICNIELNGKKYHTNMDRQEYNFFTKINTGRIEQVWIVIINNALDELVKISDISKRKLSIHISKDETNIYIKFSDSAGGINESILNKIFEPFKSTKNSSGMGIGLSIAKKIVTNHKGVIEAYNENDGATFEVTLPILIKD